MPPHSPQGFRTLPDAKALRKQVLADENTAEIARNLGVSTEEYVTQVVHFLRHTQEEPELYVIDDQALRAIGLERPDPEEMGRFIMEAASLAEAAEGKLELVPPLGVVKFSQSPFGKLLVSVGLSSITGGPSRLLNQGLGRLGKLGGGKLLGAFKGFTSRFLGPVQSFLSKPGLWGIAGFLKSATLPEQLLPMARVLFGARQKAPTPDDTTRQLIQHNLVQLFAHRHAQLAE
ncbi:hypothetical protein [Hyalangium sp.]|uniref:hypothetical protein n=1 Tax=Hyalangium sp. TaxID=2028555 RepID=UPI002D4748FD|nr:hypothetical protein [Hyalangium sp.]HYH97153.1 hypothetical protein [Hyalangium sp.]